jgi:hypothetical protein
MQAGVKLWRRKPAITGTSQYRAGREETKPPEDYQILLKVKVAGGVPIDLSRKDWPPTAHRKLQDCECDCGAA